jgi:phosphatidylglycerol---prolipoprotein diacylglyceryl transferase
MRQILFHIPLDRPWPLGPFGQVPMFGVGLLLLLWTLFGAWLLVARFRKGAGPLSSDDAWSVGRWLFVAGALLAAPQLGAYLRANGSPPFRDGLPIFGYGFMLFVAVASGGWWAARRAERQGVASEKIWDLAFCLFLSGIAGARVFYLVQYRDRVFENVHSPAGFINAVFNLSNGGIVLYGGLIAAAVGYFVFCHVHRLRPLAMLDIITPSIFLGIGFGRIGCFLNGCCYGDECHLPWAVQFPRDSATFGALVEKGLLSPDALCTMPLHPTQIYSAIDGFVIATITAWYFTRRRRRNGEVFAIGLLIYPVTRFLIEFIRGDEPGLFGTRFTISQWISAAMFLVAIGYMTWLSRRPAVVEPACTEPVSPPSPVPSESRSPSLPRAHSAAR